MNIVDFDDIESDLYRQTVLKYRSYSLYWGLKLKLHFIKLRISERKFAKKWQSVCLCSSLDAERIKSLYGVQAWVVRNGYQFGQVLPETTSPWINVLFVGSFDHKPNTAGIEWFVQDVWPKTLANKNNKMRLDIVGFNPSAEIRSLNEKDNIFVHANVPDIASYYASANIVIAPIQQGSGTRIKLLEATAQGRAIVTTSIGCEGLGFVNGIHAIIADDPAGFANGITKLAENPEQRAMIAKAATQYASNNFSSDSIERDFALRLFELVEAR